MVKRNDTNLEDGSVDIDDDHRCQGKCHEVTLPGVSVNLDHDSGEAENQNNKDQTDN